MWHEALIQAVSQEMESLIGTRGGIALSDLEYELPYPRALLFQALGRLLEAQRVRIRQWGRGYVVERSPASDPAPAATAQLPGALCDPLSQDLG